MKLKTVTLALALSAFAFNASHALQITDFSDVGFLVDETSSFSTISPNGTNIFVSGTDFLEALVGTFAPVDIAGFSDITLTGSVSGENPNSTFSIYLFNSAFDQYREYSGFTLDFGATSTTVFLTFVSETASFTDIAGFQFIGGGIGSPLSFTFESVDAIPEPSVYALSSMALAGAYLLRRRQGKVS